MADRLLTVACKGRRLEHELARTIDLLDLHWQLDCMLPANREPVGYGLTPEGVAASEGWKRG